MIISVIKKLFVILVLAISFQCRTADKKAKTSLPGPDRRIFVSGLGFVQGNVIRIKSTLTSDNNAKPNRITYILDHEGKTLTTIIDDKIAEKKIYFLDDNYRADSSVQNIYLGKETIIFRHSPLYQDQVDYSCSNNKIVDSVSYRVESIGKLGMRLYLTHSSDTTRHSIQYYDGKGFYKGWTIIPGRDTLTKMVYDYNSMGDIIKETSDSKGSGHSQQVNDYIYDQFGNWTIETSVFTYDDGRKLRMKTVRAITYK